MFLFSRLQVVSTCVGGIPEVLPPDLISLAEPSVKGEDGFRKNLFEKSVTSNSLLVCSSAMIGIHLDE